MRVARGTIVVLGQTGHGKSQFCKYLCTRFGRARSLPFTVGSNLAAGTLDVASTELVLSDRLGAHAVAIFDTPGLDDGADRDSAHILKMVTALRKVNDCIGFVMIVKAGTPRLSGGMKATLSYFREIFGTEILSNLILAFTSCSERRKNSMERERGGDGSLVNQWRRQILATFSGSGHIPAFFLNTAPDDEEVDFDYVEEFHGEQMRKLLVTALSNPPHDCSGAKVVKTLKDRERIAKEAAIKVANKAKEDAKTAKEEAEKHQKRADLHAREREAAERAAAEARREASKSRDEARRAERSGILGKVIEAVTTIGTAYISKEVSKGGS